MVSLADTTAETSPYSQPTLTEPAQAAAIDFSAQVIENRHKSLYFIPIISDNGKTLIHVNIL